jgi:hypothetical protein
MEVRRVDEIDIRRSVGPKGRGRKFVHGADDVISTRSFVSSAHPNIPRHIASIDAVLDAFRGFSSRQ